MNIDLLVAAGIGFLITLLVIRYAFHFAVLVFFLALVLGYIGFTTGSISDLATGFPKPFKEAAEAVPKSEVKSFEKDRLFSEEAPGPRRRFQDDFPYVMHHQ